MTIPSGFAKLFAHFWHSKCFQGSGTPIAAVRRSDCIAPNSRPFLAAGVILTICFYKGKHAGKAFRRKP